VIVFVPAATVFDMSALQDATTLLRLAAHQLTTLRFDALTHVGELRIEDVPALTSLQMPALTSIGGPVTVIAPQLPICQIDAILTQANYTGPRTIQAAPGPCP